MKFTYDEKQDRGECVAYLTSYNSLIIKDGFECVYLDGDGSGHVGQWDRWMPDEEATRKFYPGDSITITF